MPRYKRFRNNRGRSSHHRTDSCPTLFRNKQALPPQVIRPMVVVLSAFTCVVTMLCLAEVAKADTEHSEARNILIGMSATFLFLTLCAIGCYIRASNSQAVFEDTEAFLTETADQVNGSDDEDSDATSSETISLADLNNN